MFPTKARNSKKKLSGSEEIVKEAKESFKDMPIVKGMRGKLQTKVGKKEKKGGFRKRKVLKGKEERRACPFNHEGESSES